MQSNNYRTLSEATKHLRTKGYTDDFKMEEGKLLNLENDRTYDPEELTVVSLYRFEGMSNPSDMSVVFAVEGEDGCKGIVTAAYGTYGNRELLNFMDQVERRLARK